MGKCGVTEDKNRERQSKAILSPLSLLSRNPQNPTMMDINLHLLWFFVLFWQIGIHEQYVLEVFCQLRKLEALRFERN